MRVNEVPARPSRAHACPHCVAGDSLGEILPKIRYEPLLEEAFPPMLNYSYNGHAAFTSMRDIDTVMPRGLARVKIDICSPNSDSYCRIENLRPMEI